MAWLKQPISKGVIGIDCNPDGCAAVEVDAHGNLLHHMYEQNTRIRDAKAEKRSNDVRQMAKVIVEHAAKVSKPLVLEALSFKDRTSGPKKFRRAKHNFIYRQMLDAICSRAAKCSVPVIEVKPAFTSVLGNLKYAKMYSLNRHTAAGLVIARRGMAIQERQDFRAVTTRSKNEKVNLEGRSFEIALTKKAWSWLRGEFLKPNSAILTGSVLAAGSKPAIGTSAGAIPASKASTTGRCRDGINAIISGPKEVTT